MQAATGPPKVEAYWYIANRTGTRAGRCKSVYDPIPNTHVGRQCLRVVESCVAKESKDVSRSYGAHTSYLALWFFITRYILRIV